MMNHYSLHENIYKTVEVLIIIALNTSDKISIEKIHIAKQIIL